MKQKNKRKRVPVKNSLYKKVSTTDSQGKKVEYLEVDDLVVRGSTCPVCQC